MNFPARFKMGQLSARERSFLSAIFGAFVGVMSNVLPQLPALLAGGHINITPVIISMLIAAFILAFVRLWLGQQDPRAAEVLQAYSEQLAQAAANNALIPEGHVPVIHIVAPVSTPSAKIALAPIAQPIADMPTVQQPVVRIDTTASPPIIPTTMVRQFVHDAGAPTEVDLPSVGQH